MLLVRVLDVDTRAFGPASTRVAKALLVQAQVAQGREDWDVARVRAHASDAILRAELPTGHNERLAGLRIRGWVEFMLAPCGRSGFFPGEVHPEASSVVVVGVALAFLDNCWERWGGSGNYPRLRWGFGGGGSSLRTVSSC